MSQMIELSLISYLDKSFVPMVRQKLFDINKKKNIVLIEGLLKFQLNNFI